MGEIKEFTRGGINSTETEAEDLRRQEKRLRIGLTVAVLMVVILAVFAVWAISSLRHANRILESYSLQYDISALPGTSGVRSNHLHLVWCPIRLTDFDGYDLTTYEDDLWSLDSNQEFLAWFELPDDITQLNGKIESKYPSALRAGEIGTITFEVTCYTNNTRYYGSVDFIAADDIDFTPLAGVSSHPRSSMLGIHNDTTREFQWMEAGKSAYVYYSLYSKGSEDINCISPVVGGQSSVGYDVYYDIRSTDPDTV